MEDSSALIIFLPLALGVIKDPIAAASSIHAPKPSVSSKIPEAVIMAIGAAKNVGRDRRWQLSKLFEKPASAERAAAAIGQTGFSELESDARFDQIFNLLRQLGKPARKSASATTRAWTSADKTVKAKVTDTGKAFTLALGARDGSVANFSERSLLHDICSFFPGVCHV